MRSRKKDLVVEGLLPGTERTSSHLEKILCHGLSTAMRIEPSEYPLLFADNHLTRDPNTKAKVSVCVTNRMICTMILSDFFVVIEYSCWSSATRACLPPQCTSRPLQLSVPSAPVVQPLSSLTSERLGQVSLLLWMDMCYKGRVYAQGVVGITSTACCARRSETELIATSFLFTKSNTIVISILH